MNRFERHPVLTACLLVGLLATAPLLVVEWALTPTGARAHSLPVKRFLAMREWLPNTTYTYRTPQARYNDPVGPVDDQYTLKIDAHGFIEPSIRHNAPDFEIVFLGGSTTECLYLRPEERFPALAGELLEDGSGLKINAINAGKSGNHAMHSLLNMFGKVLPRRPRYVVLMNATNDIGWLGNHGTYWLEKKDLGLVQIRDRGTSQLLRDLRDRTFPYTIRAISKGWKVIKLRFFQVWAERKSDQPAMEVEAASSLAQQQRTVSLAPPSAREVERRKSLRAYYEPALRSFVRVAKAWGVAPVLMTQVLVGRGQNAGTGQEGNLLAPEALARGDFDRASFASIHAYANALIAHVAQSESALLINLAGARKWAVADVYDGLHLTPVGARRAARVIADVIYADMQKTMESGVAAEEP